MSWKNISQATFLVTSWSTSNLDFPEAVLHYKFICGWTRLLIPWFLPHVKPAAAAAAIRWVIMLTPYQAYIPPVSFFISLDFFFCLKGTAFKRLFRASLILVFLGWLAVKLFIKAHNFQKAHKGASSWFMCRHSLHHQLQDLMTIVWIDMRGMSFFHWFLGHNQQRPIT